MVTTSRTTYLFDANLNLLGNTLTPDVAQYNWSYQERNTHAILYKYGDVPQQIHGELSLQ